MKFNTHIPLKIRDAYASRHEPEAQRSLAYLYWTFLVVLFAVSVVATLAYGAWEFSRVPDAGSESLGLRPQATFTRTDLEAVLEGFDARAERVQERIVAPVGVTDPSR